MKTWLITGASSGFGREIAMEAIRRGDRVVATARDPSRLDSEVAVAGGRLLVLPLDVTNPASIDAAVSNVSGPIDVIVNAAGYGFVGAVEEASDGEVRDLIDTHLFGTLAVLRAVLPGMRARRTGHIVNFSSAVGLASFAGTALYSAAKFALEGLSEGLAKELKPLGIKVTIVEPGPFPTGFFGAAVIAARTIPDYDATVGAYRRRISGPAAALRGDVRRAVGAIVDATTADDPPLRLLLGRLAYDIAITATDARRTNFEQWKSITLGVDGPESR